MCFTLHYITRLKCVFWYFACRFIFRTMADELSTLENETLDVIGQFFMGITDGQSAWMISEQTVDSQGRCSDQPAIELKAITLSPEESQEFREVGSLLCTDSMTFSLDVSLMR